MIIIYPDHNVWDKVFEHGVDLATEFPKERYLLTATQEAIFEIAPTPSPLKEFIEQTMLRCEITPRPMFGFFDSQYPLAEQRIGGFGVGRFADIRQTEFIEKHKNSLGTSKRPSGLWKNEADLALASRAFDSVVLTLDVNKGPLKRAKTMGLNVITLKDYQWEKEGLGGYVEKLLRKKDQAAAGIN